MFQKWFFKNFALLCTKNFGKNNLKKHFSPSSNHNVPIVFSVIFALLELHYLEVSIIMTIAHIPRCLCKLEFSPRFSDYI